MPGQSLGQHLARQLHMGLDHLGARERAAAPGGEPVGRAEQGDVGGDGLGGAEVLIDGAARQRALIDQEAEAQVVQGQPLKVGAEGVACSKPAADPGDDLGSRAVVADEGDVAGPLASRRRLAEVVEERAEAQRIGARELVGERLGQEGRRSARPGRGRSRPGPIRSRATPPAPPACGRGRRGGGSGSGRRRGWPPAPAARRPSARAGPAAPARAAAPARRASRAARRTGARRPPRPPARPGSGPGAASPPRSPASGRPRSALRASAAAGPRVKAASLTARRRRASASARPPVGSIGSPPRSGTATALTVKSRAPRSSLDRVGAQRGHVDVPLAVAVPWPTTTRQVACRSDSGKATPPEARGDRPRGVLLAAGRAPPGRRRRRPRTAARRAPLRRRSKPVRSRRAPRARRRPRPRPPGAAPGLARVAHCPWARGTRGETPVVIS